jgi:hypothetical protein
VAFVRTKRVGDYEYRQLVENYRENGHHRQRVLAHLGHADTVEGAIEGARRKLSDLDGSRPTEKIREAEAEVAEWEASMREDYGDQLAPYHDSQVPTPAEARKHPALYADYYDYKQGHRVWDQREWIALERRDYERDRQRLQERIAKLERAVRSLRGD